MMPFVDLKMQYRSINVEVAAALLEVFEDAQFALGPQVAAFDSLFADYRSSRALGVNLGTSALHVAMVAASIGRADEVVATPVTFMAIVSTIDVHAAVRREQFKRLPEIVDVCGRPYAGTSDLPWSEHSYDRHIVHALFPGMSGNDVRRAVAGLAASWSG